MLITPPSSAIRSLFPHPLSPPQVPPYTSRASSDILFVSGRILDSFPKNRRARTSSQTRQNVRRNDEFISASSLSSYSVRKDGNSNGYENGYSLEDFPPRIAFAGTVIPTTKSPRPIIHRTRVVVTK